MGTTGTITGVSQYLKEKNPDIRIIGVQPNEGSRIPWHSQVAASLFAQDL
jgi:cysteine synthase B